MKIQVLRLLTGAGKIFYTKEVAGDTMKKIVTSVELNYRGIRAMELHVMEQSEYDKIPPDKIAVAEIGIRSKY